MKNKLLWLLTTVCLLIIQGAFAQNEYAVDKIPAELLENANAVVRYYSSSFVLESESQAKESIQFTVTILNKNGLYLSYLNEGYDKFSRINKIKGKVYGKNGELIKSIKREDIEDYSAIANYSMYEESRRIFVDPKYMTTPFTVEYSYEITYTGLLEYPDWSPFFGYDVSAEKVEFSITRPENKEVRFLTQNIETGPKSEVIDLTTVYSWSYQNFVAITTEDFTVNISNIVPRVMVSPMQFDMNGYKGDYRSWGSYGLWIKKLNDENSEFSVESQLDVLKVVEGVSDTLEKIRLLYKYLQSKVRYVNISIGMGGWQPYPPETVHNVSYGDCKALSWYMHTLLKTIGIKSWYTVVIAGDNPPEMIPDFPANIFNHAILCVPVANDTIWLECTSLELPCGFLSTFTDGRKALLITDQGGVLATIGDYTLKENQQQSKAVVKITENHGATIDLTNHYTGFYYDKWLGAFSMDNVEKKRYITENLKVVGYELKNFNLYDDRSKPLPVIREELQLNVFDVFSTLRDKYILPLNLLHESIPIPGKNDIRNSDILVRRPYQTVDSLIFIIPDDLTIDYLPENVDIETRYGTYKTTIALQNQQIIFVRTFTMNKGLYPKSGYDDFVGFFEKIDENNNLKCILLKKVE